MRATRAALGVAGVVLGLYGAWLLVSREGSTTGLVGAGTWLVVGVLLHDAVLVPVTLVLLLVGGRVLPASLRRPATVGLVVLGTVTAVAIPVLTGYGRRADNPTLDDRHYWWGWLVVAALVVVGVLVAAVLVRVRGASGPAPARGGPRRP